MKIAYADPPYPGCAHRYKDHKDYAGEVDHAELIDRLYRDYDGFVLHTSSTALRAILPLVGKDARIMAWVKPFAAFKRNVSVAYAWEPVIVKPCRKPVVSGRIVMRDWVSESITLKKGLCGAKPDKVCAWAFEMLGAEPQDELVDLFPGTGAVTAAWENWRTKCCGHEWHDRRGCLVINCPCQPAPKQEAPAPANALTDAERAALNWAHTIPLDAIADILAGVGNDLYAEELRQLDRRLDICVKAPAPDQEE